MAEIITILTALAGVYGLFGIMAVVRFYLDRQELFKVLPIEQQNAVGMHYMVVGQYIYAFIAWPHLHYKVYWK